MAGFSSFLRRFYLTAYNWIVFAGWFQVLFLALKTLKESGHQHVYSNIEKPLLLAQSAAFLEILHGIVGEFHLIDKLRVSFAKPFFRKHNVFSGNHGCLGLGTSKITAKKIPVGLDETLIGDMYLLIILFGGFLSYMLFLGSTGLVRSPISATLPQISSRLYVVWGILYSFPEVQTHPLVSSLVISWCITEIIRYSFFGTKEAFGSTPYWLLWLRYSTFLILYPTGIASEIGMIYNALPFMKESGLYSVRMPNKWNFSFDYFYGAIVVIAIYVPGIPHLYGYMLGQRKKTLSKSKKE